MLQVKYFNIKIMIKIKQSILALMAGSIILLGSCGKSEKSATGTSVTEVLPDDIVEMRADQIKLADIELGTIEIRSIGNIIKVNGIVSVAPKNHATVCMPLGGFVKSTSLVPGNNVRKGEILAVIENQDFVDIQQDYLETKNKLQFAEADFKRHTELYKDDVYSQQNVQLVTVDYHNLKAKARSLEQKLQLIGIDPEQLREDNISSTSNLVSPITGFLSAVNVHIGQYVTQTDVLFEIVNSDKLFLELTLFEKDAGRVSAGQKMRFYISNETEAHDAVITQTGKSVSNDKTFKAYAAVSSTCPKLLPGMYVNAFIEESDNRVTALPSDAVVNFDDRDYIFTYERDKEEAGKAITEYRIFQVKKGVTSAGYTEISLPAGFDISAAKVVIKGAYNLLSAKKNAGEMAC
jgi:membrane fusion protein, heavy metal efflux system